MYDYFNETYYIGDTLISNFEKYRKELEADEIKPFPYVVDVCRRVYESNRNHLYTHRGKSSIDYLKKYDMLKYFTGLITRESNFKRKPDLKRLRGLNRI